MNDIRIKTSVLLIQWTSNCELVGSDSKNAANEEDCLVWAYYPVILAEHVNFPGLRGSSELTVFWES